MTQGDDSTISPSPKPPALPPPLPPPLGETWKSEIAYFRPLPHGDIVWITVGSYPAGQFHSARAMLRRYNIESRAGLVAEDSACVALQVPSTEVQWALDVLAGRGGSMPTNAPPLHAVPEVGPVSQVGPQPVAGLPPFPQGGTSRGVLPVQMPAGPRSSVGLTVAIWLLWALLIFVVGLLVLYTVFAP